MVATRMEALLLMRRGLMFLVNRKQAGAMSAWKGRVFGRGGDDPMGKALRYFLNRNLARGWVNWQALWAEKKAKLESMRRSLSHALNRELSRGWGAWVEMAVERALFMQKLRKGVSFMVNRKMAVGFASWRQRVSGVSDDPMAKALRYFLNRNLARGWVN